MFKQRSFYTTCILFILCSAAGTVPAARAGSSAALADAPAAGATYQQHASLAVEALQTWYDSKTGQYAPPAGWWNTANAITALVDYERVARDTTYLPVIANTFTKAQTGSSGHLNFTNKYYDDSGWWALAWIDAYDLTGNRQYLSMAETIFTYITGAWDTTTCGGGVWWSADRKYKNAIANELFLTIAAKLANRTTGASSAAYLAWAQKEWTWFLGSGMINASNLINDGVNSTNPAACTNNHETTWSYNQGVILDGLVELSKATADPALLARAQSIANAVLSPASGLLTSGGTLVDRTVSGGDAPQFKGIFMRNLRALYTAAPRIQYRSFARKNADSIWANDNSGNRLGGLWQGPFDSADATRQSSALDAIIAAEAMR